VTGGLSGILPILKVRSVLDFVVVSSKNLDLLEHDENPAKSAGNPIKSMVLCAWQVMERDGLKWLKVDF
jgi:hypothetical protein